MFGGEIGGGTGLIHAHLGSLTHSSLAGNCLARNEWICGAYLSSRRDELLTATLQHLQITAISVVVGALVAFPLALLVRRTRLLKGGLLGATTVLYAIPSLALIPAMVPFTGLSIWTVVVPLILYSLVVLLRNILAGLDAVPAGVLDAARGMGYGPGRLLWSVELPLALPAVVAGVRIATVSTVAMATIGSLVGFGGLGNLLLQGQRSFFNAQVLTAAVAVVLLALVLDLLLLAAQRALTPRRARATPAEPSESSGPSRAEGVGA